MKPLLETFRAMKRTLRACPDHGAECKACPRERPLFAEVDADAPSRALWLTPAGGMSLLLSEVRATLEESGLRLDESRLRLAGGVGVVLKEKPSETLAGLLPATPGIGNAATCSREGCAASLHLTIVDLTYDGLVAALREQGAALTDVIWTGR